MSKISYNEQYSYEVFSDGYDIFDYDKRIITQREPFGKVFDRSKTYEENAIMQIESMIMPEPTPGPSETDKLRADIDYIALMTDLTLPSEEEEE